MEQPELRIKALAADLAHGALTGMWNSELPEPLNQVSGLGLLLRQKWNDSQPGFDLLVSFGYLSSGFRYNSVRYTLTQKAFDLLQAIPPKTKIFISYGRLLSSPFALALQYKLLSLRVDAFLDREIDLGEAWHAFLQSKIEVCDYFICLLTPSTLDSENVRKEIKWAQESGRACIPVWHAGFSPKDHLDNRPDMTKEAKLYIKAKNACIIEGKERASIYHNAINSILNQLGYST